jgi:ribonuclease-3
VPDTPRLEERLGHDFVNKALLRLALTHPSLAQDPGAASQHNQRLEFLGDAVLQLVLTEELYAKFPEVGEGPLTKARAQMANRRTLADQARRLDLGEALSLSRGDELSGGRQRQSTLSDTLEAVIGAIYLDGGLESARRFILRLFREAFGELEAIPNLENPKGELQEFLQAGTAEAPNYEQISVTGPDHDRLFECAVFHRGIELGRGRGKSKKQAESAAARAALQRLQPADPPASLIRSAPPRV